MLMHAFHMICHLLFSVRPIVAHITSKQVASVKRLHVSPERLFPFCLVIAQFTGVRGGSVDSLHVSGEGGLGAQTQIAHIAGVRRRGLDGRLAERDAFCSVVNCIVVSLEVGLVPRRELAHLTLVPLHVWLGGLGHRQPDTLAPLVNRLQVRPEAVAPLGFEVAQAAGCLLYTSPSPRAS